MKLMEEKVSGKEIFAGRVLRLEVDTVRLENEKLTTREVIRHNGAVAVIPLTEDNKVIMVRQYRYPLERVTLEIPAGKLEKGEDPYSAVVRELQEETGAQAKEIQCLGKIHPSVAILDECITLYFARGLSFTNQSPDDDEFLLVEAIPLRELCDMVMEGKITDAKTQIAALKVAAILTKEKKEF